MGKPRQRNHEIPRFLLNRFSTRAEGKKRWVWRIGRDGSIRELSTRNVAVSPRFYEAGVEDALQIVEGRFSGLLASIDGGHPPGDFPEELRQLVWTLVLRTRAIREQFATVIDAFLSEFAAWGDTAAAGDELVRQLRSTLDERIEEVVASLPLEQRRLAAAAARLPAVREQILDDVRSNAGPWAGAVARMMQEQGVIPTSVRTAQLRGLADLLSRGTVPDVFEPRAWQVISAERHGFVLGDACVFTRLEDGSLGSLLKSAKNWSEVYLPISDRQVLVATKDRVLPSLNNASINQASAAVARMYVYASCSRPTAHDLIPQIGTREPLLSRDELAGIVRQCLKSVGSASTV